MKSNKLWKSEIVSVMSENKGHEMSLRHIYRKMLQSSLVSDYHLAPWKPGGQPRYQCWIRSLVRRLVNDGTIDHVRRGVYLLR